MRRITILLIHVLLVLAAAADAQVRNPVGWAFTAKALSPGRYEVRITATMEKGWHIYAQNTPDGGPIPTKVAFTRNPLVTLTGTVREVGKLETHFEKLFDVNVRQYSNKVEFVQTVTVKGSVKTNLAGTVEYMACNDSECLPPVKKNFSVPLK